jgi:UDP-GlcNAc:undecaprenyl-phosphate/decaprenyl-phosphate GlcNAc-1-phosphate transferase
MMINFTLIFVSLLLNFFLFSLNDVIAKKIYLYDVPNKERKLHKFPTPLNGGIFYFLNLFLIFIFDIFYYDLKILSIFGFINESDVILVLLILLSLLILGIIDDKLSLKPTSKSLASTLIFFSFLSIRMDFQIIGLRFEMFGFWLDLFGLSLIFTILCFVVLQIIFNMYDGINLQSAIYYSIILLYLIIRNQNNAFSIFCILTLINLIFFAFYNYKQKIFLGDNGVYIFSFILALLIIKTYQIEKMNFYVEEILIIFFIPFIDALRLFFKRLIRNNNPFYGDRKHLHHILSNKFGLIKTNLLLIFPLFFSLILISQTTINLTIILGLNFIMYVYLLKYIKNG